MADLLLLCLLGVLGLGWPVVSARSLKRPVPSAAESAAPQRAEACAASGERGATYSSAPISTD